MLLYSLEVGRFHPVHLLDLVLFVCCKGCFLRTSAFRGPRCRVAAVKITCFQRCQIGYLTSRKILSRTYLWTDLNWEWGNGFLASAVLPFCPEVWGLIAPFSAKLSTFIIKSLQFHNKVVTFLFWIVSDVLGTPHKNVLSHYDCWTSALQTFTQNRPFFSDWRLLAMLFWRAEN